MVVYSITVPITSSELTAAAGPDAEQTRARFCAAFQVELRRALPYVQVTVGCGRGAPCIAANSEEECQRARRSIDAAYNRVMGRGAWRQAPETVPPCSRFPRSVNREL